MNKFIYGLIAVLVLVSVPLVSASKDIAPETPSDSVTLSKTNLLVLTGEINGDSTGQLILKTKELDAKLSGLTEKYKGKTPIYLFLNSPGGSIQSGLELIEALRGIGRKVNTISLFSASMAFQLVQNLDDRLVLKGGVLMSHHAMGETQGQFGGVRPGQMDNRQQLWLDRIQELDEQTVKRTNGKQTYASYIAQYDHEFWLNGTKSVNQGYADRVVTVKCDSSLSGVTTNHVNFMGMDIAYDLDNCPLNTNPMNVHVSIPGDKAISSEVIADIKGRFIAQYLNKQRQVVPMYW